MNESILAFSPPVHSSHFLVEIKDFALIIYLGFLILRLNSTEGRDSLNSQAC